jgi:ADP-L-glycero-D-manno-heptose 6-epimerase
MIIVTGAEGFIGSCLLALLNEHQYHDIILVDDFNALPARSLNLIDKKYTEKVERSHFFSWMDTHAHEVQFVFHIGAKTDTTEKDEAVFKELNLRFSQELFKKCALEGIPMVYASSAATYGAGEFGYQDDESKLEVLNPLNPYGRSKNDFDKWVLSQEHRPYFWAGLKFFNVYGPNEYHKARMASVVYHAYHQIKNTGEVNLFQSHRQDYEHGAQMRDFIYVKDLCEVCLFLMHHRKNSGIYNLGSGKARTWNNLAQAIFMALNKPVKINYVPIPVDIRDSYQYFTEASMDKLRQIGYTNPFTSIEDGVKDYVCNYLEKESWR